MNPQRVQQILKDEDFTAIVTRTKERLTAKVMAKATGDFDRTRALAEFHALDSLIAQMRSEAQNTKETP